MNIRLWRRFFWLYLIGALFVVPGWYLLSREATFDRFIEIEQVLIPVVVIMGCWLGYVRRQRRRHEARVRSAATVDERGFFLVLRSFGEFEYYETRGGSLDAEGRLPAAPESILPRLGEALADIGVPVLIGEPALYNSDDTWPGLIVRTSDSLWRTAFDYLSQSCRAIVLVPGDSPGSLTEIETILQAGLWHKTIVFVTPPIYSDQISRYDGWDDPDAKPTVNDAFRNIDQKILRQKEAAWAELRRSLDLKGIHLPAYEGSGFVYLPNPDLSARVVETFTRAGESDAHVGRLTVARMRDAFHALLSKERLAGSPLAEVLGQLEVIEHSSAPMPQAPADPSVKGL